MLLRQKELERDLLGATNRKRDILDMSEVVKAEMEALKAIYGTDFVKIESPVWSLPACELNLSPRHSQSPRVCLRVLYLS